MKKLLILLLISNPILSLAITLEQALSNAYDNAANFTIIRNDFLKDMEEFPQALSAFLPNINANISTGHRKTYDRQNKSESNGIHERETPARHSNELTKTIQLSQPIFSGGSGVAGLKAAQHSFRAARANYYSKEQTAIIEAVKVYIDYYTAKEKYNIALTSSESSKKQLMATEAKLKIGESTQSEYSTAVANMAVAETNQLSACANLEAARANFIRMFNVEPTDITLPEIPKTLPTNFADLITKVKTHNFDIEYVQHTLKATKTREMISKGKLLPQVSLDVKATHYGTKLTRLPQSGNHHHYNHNDNIYSGISVDIPIYSHGGVEYSKIRLAKNETRKLVIMTDNKIKEIETAAIRSWESFNAQKASIIAATEGEKAAQIAYDAAVEEHNVGTKTMIDVITMLERLNKSKLDKLDVLTQYTRSAFELKALVSELTAEHLKLKVNYFNPECEFKKSKVKIIGF